MAFNWIQAVEKGPEVVESAATAIEGIVSDIQDLGITLPPALTSFLSELSGKSTQIGQAVAANTPAAPPQAQPEQAAGG